MIRGPYGTIPHVVSACFAGLPEDGLLTPALAKVAVVTRVADRGRVLPSLANGRCDALLLPSVDARGVGTEALAELCHTMAPEVSVIVIASRRPGAPRAVGRSVRSGALVVSVRTARELRTVVARALGRRGGTRRVASRAAGAPPACAGRVR